MAETPDGARTDLSPGRFGTAFRAFMDAVVAEAAPPASPLLERLRAHLGTDPSQLPVFSEEFDPFEHPNVQVALDAYLAEDGRASELAGVAAANKRFMSMGLSDLLIWSTGAGRGGLAGGVGLAEGPVDYVNFHLAGGRVLACVQFGLYLVASGEARLVAFVTGPSFGSGSRQHVRVEVVGTSGEACQAFLAALKDGMRRLNVYRGHVISLSPGQMGMGPQTLVAFHTLPAVPREGVVLPAGLLERVERHTAGFAERAAALLAAGRSLKRGLLLFGPPGVGKTLTVMYLAGRMPGRTVLLTTGRGMGMVSAVAQMARALAPAMVVLEDVDLIALERGGPHGVGPLLFELLNEMDGLSDDCDVIFALTTNRPDVLEPALAARPGRIDLAVELPLPDAPSRRRLLELYGRGLTLRGVDLDRLAARMDGVSPAYIKELLRRAALLAVATDGPQEPGPDGALVVGEAHLAAAMEELDEGGRLAQRLLGLRPDGIAAGEPSGHPAQPAPGRPAGAPPTGFPVPGAWSSTSTVVRRGG